MRELVQIISAEAAQDGDGVKIHRLAGRHLHQALNPFLMIDEINSDDAADYIGGFPEHPHRGFETITYMKAGRMRHRDHMGNEGVIGSGDLQWMTAGAGVLHSEMPEQEQGLLHGFQIWLNLPAAEKMKPAAYLDIANSEVTQQCLDGGGLARVIAGGVTVNRQALQGPLPEISTQPIMVDLKLSAGETVELEFNMENPALVYVYKGATGFLLSQQIGIFSEGSALQLEAGLQGAELLVLSGRPIAEPIVQLGPFVMNAREEIERAITDFQDPLFLSRLESDRKAG
jgi:redox-sensitive bicupin YhaK (pirin superfamily)